MFRQERKASTLSAAFALGDVIYHATVRNVRRSHANALVGLLLNIVQTMILVAVFYVMFALLGMRSSGIRGDYLLYILSGVFLYLTHTKTVSAVVGAEGPTSPMMHHGPMTTFVSITSSALGALYIQVLSVVVVLFVYHAAIAPIEIYQPVNALAMLLLSWLYGLAVGLVLFAIKPWFPQFVSIASKVYTRANMVASGKMFLANKMSFVLLSMFDWNPLFHTIDQARGFAFINYNPHYSNVLYPLWVTLAVLAIGLMGENFTRKRASISWGARS